MRRNDTISVGAFLPGYALRLAAVATAAGAALVVGAPLGWTVAATVVAILGAIAPQSGGVWMAAAGLVLVMIFLGPHAARTVVLIAAVHLLHVLASLCAVIPMRALVSLRALRPAGLRFLLVQAVAQAASLAASALPDGPALPLAVLAGAGAVVLLALLAGRMLHGGRISAFPRSTRAEAVDVRSGASVRGPS